MQVSVDVPWSPQGVDGRNYDWAGLAAAADLVFVMAYDMQSQAGLPPKAAGTPVSTRTHAEQSRQSGQHSLRPGPGTRSRPTALPHVCRESSVMGGGKWQCHWVKG